MSRLQAWIVTASALCVLGFAALFVFVWVLNVDARRTQERRERQAIEERRRELEQKTLEAEAEVRELERQVRERQGR